MIDARFSPPLAFLLTFHTYGTWLPGDPRGTVRRTGSRYGDPYRGRSDALLRRSESLLRSPPVVLFPEERVVVRRAFEEVCQCRGWALLAGHVLSNHVHLVARAGAPPGRILGDLKAWATRRVVEAGHRPQGTRLWVRQGSTRHLWTLKAVESACFYTLHEQGVIVPGTVCSAP